MDNNDPGFQQFGFGFYRPEYEFGYELAPATNTYPNTWTMQPSGPNLEAPNQISPSLETFSHPAPSEYQQNVPDIYMNPGFNTNYNCSSQIMFNHHQFYGMPSSVMPPPVIYPQTSVQDSRNDYAYHGLNNMPLPSVPTQGLVVHDSYHRPSINQAMLVQDFERPSEVPFNGISLSDSRALVENWTCNTSPMDNQSVGQNFQLDTQASPHQVSECKNVNNATLRQDTVICDKKKKSKAMLKKKRKSPQVVKTPAVTSTIKLDEESEEKNILPGDLRELLTKTSSIVKKPIVRKPTVAKPIHKNPVITRLTTKSPIVTRQNIISRESKTTIVTPGIKKQRGSNLLQMLEPLLRMNYSIRLRSTGQLDGSSRYTISLTKKRSELLPDRLSSLYNSKNSVLLNLASYRLTNRFASTGKSVTDLNFTHNICPHDYICLPDLIGTCPDKSCRYQHQSNYLMTDIDKLVDILSYKPSLTGFRSDPCLSQEENFKNCRHKLKQYAAKLIAKNADKSVETIAQNLLRYVRGDKPDHELLVLRRKLPKVSQLSSRAIVDTGGLQRKESIKSLADRLLALERTQANLQKSYK